MRNITTQPVRRWQPTLFVTLPLVVALAVGLAVSGCSSLVDTNPSTTSTPPEPNVMHYYIHLDTTNVEYDYTVTSNAEYRPASGTLAMSMQGNSDTFGGMPVYACLWKYANYGTPQQWFYCLCDTEAVAMGLEPTDEHYTDSWVDLKANSAAPLQLGATWTFTSQGEQITAKVTQYGGTAQVEGKTYNDVMMVQYIGANGTTGTEWFAHNIGLIFNHVQRPNFGTVENHLLQVKQP